MRCRRQTWERWALALVFVLASCLFLSRAEGAAALPIVSGAGADWGLKESLRAYVEDGGGSIVPGDGATRNGDGSFHFPVAGGSYDPASRTTVLAFGGSLRLSGDEGQLDLALRDLSVEIGAGGAWLSADMSAASVEGGRIEYPNAVLAELSWSEVEPAIAGGTTTWAGIPAALAGGGAAALDRLYLPGAPLDAFSFSYDGPGGGPVAEEWMAPAAPAFEQLAGEQAPAATAAMFIDREHGVLHAASPAGLRALALGSLDQLGATAPAAPLPPGDGYAFDPGGTVFAVPDSSTPAPVRAFTWSPTLRVYEEEELPIDAVSSTRLAYDQAAAVLYAVEGTGSPATPLDGQTLTPAVALAARGGGGWSTLSRPPLETENRGVSSLAISAAGSLIATMHPAYAEPLSPETIHPTPPARLFDNGTSLEVRSPWDVVPPAPPAGAYTLGYSQAVPATDGTVTLVEPSPPAPMAHAAVARPDDWAYAVEPPFELGPGVRGYVIDDVDGTGYALQSGLGQIGVFRESEPVATITTAPTGAEALEPALGAASGDVLYFHNGAEPEGIYAYRQSAESATVLSQPQDAVATLAAIDGSTSAAFSAEASGDPAPTVRWQRRAAGSTGWGWANVPGATNATLRVKATAAAAGDRYRAVFSNLAGEVATRAASLSVRVLPPPQARVEAPGESAMPFATTARRRSVPAALRPGLRVARGSALTVGRNGAATVAWVACRPPQPCLLQLPRKVNLRIAGAAFAARVLASRSLPAARATPVKLRLPPPAREAIAGTEAKATLTLRATSGEQRLSRTLTVTLRGRNR